MHIASQLMRRRMHHRIHELGSKITLEQLAVLEMLKFHGAMNMSELAHLTVKENAVITRMVDILEREAYVERKPRASDRRAWEIHITNNGLKLFDELIPDVGKELQKATECLTKEEYEEGMRIMIKIIKHNQGF